MRWTVTDGMLMNRVISSTARGLRGVSATFMVIITVLGS